MCAYWFQLILKWMCSEWPSVDHMNKVQYLLGCHRRYTAGLLQLSLSTSPVEQPRGDENTARSPLAHTGSKIEARKQFRTFFFSFFCTERSTSLLRELFSLACAECFDTLYYPTQMYDTQSWSGQCQDICAVSWLPPAFVTSSSGSNHIKTTVTLQT